MVGHEKSGHEGEKKKEEFKDKIKILFFFCLFLYGRKARLPATTRFSPLFLYSFLLMKSGLCWSYGTANRLFYSYNISTLLLFQSPQVVFGTPFLFRFVSLPLRMINIFRCLNAYTGPCCWTLQDNDARVRPTRFSLGE